MFKDIKSKNEFLYTKNGVSVSIKREDLLHPFISGNKYRKLKYNIKEALSEKKTTILTFGGAYSNHIAATAYAGFANGIKTIGVIRGEELQDNLDDVLKTNKTLQFAKKHGMAFYFISREAYREKTNPKFIASLSEMFGDFYLVPEGGTNNFAIKGCEEILTDLDEKFDYICTAVGTGGTVSGLINSAKNNQKVFGFSALKGDFLKQKINQLAKNKNNWELITDFHFGGFAKITDELISFINAFKKEYKIALDPIYTGKMCYGIDVLIRDNYFPKGTKIIVIHTGGLQGIEAINKKLKKKGKIIIE
jgi:1-aminocyclopropane-1-carboxylate deaminase